MSQKSPSGPPKYKQIRELVLGLAEEQNWGPGQQLPTELELVRRYRVSRNTVRQAFSDLEHEGLIYRKQGQGTFFAGTERERRGRHFLVGAIVSNTAYIYTEIIQGAERVLSAAGYHLLMGRSTLNLAEDRQAGKPSGSWNPDGFLLELWHPDQAVDLRKVVENLKSTATPFVLLNSDDPDASFVAPDDLDAGARAGSYLLARGHQRIAFVGIRGHGPSENRLKGLLSSASAAGKGVPSELIRMYEGHDTRQQSPAFAATTDLLSLGSSRPTAVFYVNDEAASQGYAAIREHGLSVPRDISVVGFDDSQLSRALYPPLTTFLHPKGRVGELAARILLDRIENPESFLPVHALYTCRLIERESVRNLAKEGSANG